VAANARCDASSIVEELVREGTRRIAVLLSSLHAGHAAENGLREAVAGAGTRSGHRWRGSCSRS